jgi:O-antigen ligase
VLTLTLALVALACFIVLTTSTSSLVAALSLIIATTCLFPASLQSSSSAFHVGIAGPTPEIRTFHVLFGLLLVLSVARHGVRCIHPMHLVFVAWIAVGAARLWHPGPLLNAGLLQLGIGVAAWSVGTAYAKQGATARDERLICWMLSGFVAVEITVSLLQFAGFSINQLDVAESSILGTRVNGTANHPNNLGKLLIASLILLLPLSDSKSPRTARLALVSCIAMFVPLGLAQGRANMLAFICALILWALLSANSKYSGRRLAVLAATLAGVGASATALVSRFEEDPQGGVRNDIFRIALESIPYHLWTGVGPNSYVAEIASKSGSNIPVHNSFVLLLAETGMAGLVLFATPAAVAVLRSATRCRTDPYARALVVAAPGIVAIGWTGWGLLGTSVLPLLTFSIAYTAGRMRSMTYHQKVPARRTRTGATGTNAPKRNDRPL